MRHVLGPDMKIASALLAGLLFGLGLIVSGMADPARCWVFWTWPVPGIRRWPS